MEIKFDLDLDFYDEDGTSINESIKSTIINGIIDRIYKSVKGNYVSEINELIKKKVEVLIEKTFDSFLEQEITITDRYGDAKEIGNVKEIIKHRFDNWLGEKVDSQGRTGSYNSKYERINFIVEQQLQNHSQKFVQEAVTAVADKLEKTLSEDLRTMIGQKISDKIGLNKLLPKMIKK